MVSLLPWTLCPKTRQVRQVRSVSCQFWLAVLAVGNRGAMPEDAGSINLELWDRRVWSKDRSTLAKINVQASTRNTVNMGNQEILSVAAFVSSNFQVKDTQVCDPLPCRRNVAFCCPNLPSGGETPELCSATCCHLATCQPGASCERSSVPPNNAKLSSKFIICELHWIYMNLYMNLVYEFIKFVRNPGSFTDSFNDPRVSYNFHIFPTSSLESGDFPWSFRGNQRRHAPLPLWRALQVWTRRCAWSSARRSKDGTSATCSLTKEHEQRSKPYSWRWMGIQPGWCCSI